MPAAEPPLDPDVLPLIEAPAPPRDVAARRAAQEESTARLGGEPVAMARVAEREDAPVRVREYVPPGEPRGAVVYFHGGGWVIGSVDAVDRLVRRLAAAADARVLAVGYRLAPEHPYPAAVEDAEAAVRWAADAFGEPLAVAGDSAGANLATVAARRAGVPLRLQALLYPITDAAMDTGSYARFAEGFYLRAADMAWFWSVYGAEPGDPDASPLRAPLEALAGLPPAFVLTASHDVLRDEGEAYAERLRAAGAAAEIRRWPGMVHGFLRWPGISSAARAALEETGERLRQALAG